MNIVVKTNKSKLGDSYFDVLYNNKVVTRKLSNVPVHTARGMYTTFILPSLKCSGDFNSESIAYTEIKRKPQCSTVYQDVLIDRSSELYERLHKFKELLIGEISEAVRDICVSDPGCALAKYVDKYCTLDTIENEVNIMFIKYDKSTNAYLHMKVLPTTRSYNYGSLVNNEYLMYKSFMTIPTVKIDNVRIPVNRNTDNKLNVHLAIVSQEVSLI